MFFSELPPDTSSYMVAGYVIFFLVTAIYLASLFIRTRNLNRDLEAVETLKQEEQRPPAPRTPAPARPRPSKSRAGGAKQARRKTPRKR